MDSQDFDNVFLDDDNLSDTNEYDNNFNTNTEDLNIFSNQTKIAPKEATIRISKPNITKYERVRILGERTKQIIMGAKPLVKTNDNNLTPYDIALLEYDNNMIPLKIKRYLPNNTYEIWKFYELNKF